MDFILPSLTFATLISKEITKEKFDILRSSTPKRIRHVDHDIINTNVDKTKSAIAFINIPFTETIESILLNIVSNLRFKVNKYDRYGAPVYEPEDLDGLQSFLNTNEKIVFIKSLLSCMIALDMNFESGTDNYTEIGRHEHQGKEHRVKESINFITSEIVEIISNFPIYKEAHGISVVPKSNYNSFCFPQLIAERVSTETDIEDFTNFLKFENKNRSLQNENAENRWQTLEDSNLTINPQHPGGIEGKTIILLDDLYQSGTTMHYTAMRLQESGAEHILGLAIVKARSDTDNSKS